MVLTVPIGCLLFTFYLMVSDKGILWALIVLGSVILSGSSAAGLIWGTTKGVSGLKSYGKKKGFCPTVDIE